jgi:hypothetical protein
MQASERAGSRWRWQGAGPCAGQQQLMHPAFTECSQLHCTAEHRLVEPTATTATARHHALPMALSPA